MIMSDSEIEKIEVVSNEEVRYQRSEFASVIFHNVADTYPADAHVECSYTLTIDIIPSTRDWVGIYKVGWMSSRDYIYYEWAPLPKNYEQGKEIEATILFQAHTLPKDDGEFYQFCYVSSAGQIRGASTPFQFKRPSAGDFVEVEDDDTDMLIIRSRTMVLQENLKKKEEENIDLMKYRDTMSKEVTSLADKITDLQKKLVKSEQEQRDMQKLYKANEKKIDEMLSDANDMTMVHDELRSKVDEKEKECQSLVEKVSQLQSNVGVLQEKMKALQNEKDELEGTNKTLQEEMDLYKNHLSQSETSVGSHVQEIESLNSRLAESGKITMKLQRKIEEQDEAMDACREELTQVKMELHQEQRRMEQQVHVTHSEQENVTALTEKLRNAEDKLASEENTKELMRQELKNFRDAQDKMSQDLASSKSECHMMKTQICRMEEDFAQENTVLLSENSAIQRDLENVLKEKEVLQAKMCSLQDELLKTQENVECTEGPMFALQQANNGLKQRLLHLNERYNKLTDEKKQARVRDRELNREIVDLKERIHMCSEEYKQIYKENKKLQKKTDKLLGHRSWRDTKSESESVTSEKLQTSSSKSTPERSTSCETVTRTSVMGVSELQALLATERQKKDRYKQQHREEKERLETLRRHYHEELQAKDVEIARLKQLATGRDSGSGDSGALEQRVMSLEKYLEDKQKMIDELNQKLRDVKLECETPKPAKRSTIPRKTEPEVVCSVKSEARSSSPKLIYGNPYKEESKKLTLQEQAAMCPPAAVSHPPAAVSHPPQTQQMSRYEEQEEVFVDASACLIPLPRPMEPEVTSEAKMAAVKATMPQPGGSEELEGHCYGMPAKRTGITPSAPPSFPTHSDSCMDDIVVKLSDGKWLIDSNGETRKCPQCSEVFPAELREEDFMEHVLGHMGRICPVCKKQVDDNMDGSTFEYHVHCCIGEGNN
ncbi:tax1-binding protein 1 homolog isoform X1 [Haliotis cracherodii]|uniref:tax1-binding protein 1 homolog isoform X1 n=2 Tax=Haliotis cracherodii TaxID=6455 RepID=UPI0039EC54AA